MFVCVLWRLADLFALDILNSKPSSTHVDEVAVAVFHCFRSLVYISFEYIRWKIITAQVFVAEIPQTLFNGFEICIRHKRICCDLYGERFTLPLDRKRALYYSHSRNASSSARVHSCRCSLWFFDRYVIKNMCERVPMIGLPRLRAPNEIANLIQCKLVLCVGYM